MTNTDRSAAIALVLGSLAGLTTMALHPSGGDVVRNASVGGSNTFNTGVHLLAVLAQPMLVAGTLAVTAHLRARRDFAIAGYVCFALASVAILVAAVASGLLAPDTVRGLSDASEAQRATMLGALRYTGLVNRAFARVGVVLVGAAIVWWSIAMQGAREFPRALAVYGLVFGGALLAGIVTGVLQLDVHGFGLVVLGQGAWMVWVATRLWRGAA